VAGLLLQLESELVGHNSFELLVDELPVVDNNFELLVDELPVVDNNSEPLF